jgi:hypothetical protein
MFCLYTLPLARPAQAKIQMLTTSSWIFKTFLKSLLKSLGLYLTPKKILVAVQSNCGHLSPISTDYPYLRLLQQKLT